MVACFRPSLSWTYVDWASVYEPR